MLDKHRLWHWRMTSLLKWIALADRFGMHTALTPRREWALLLTLAGVQFTHVLDFMIMMPLGPQLTALFGISDAQFGLLVSGYTFAAGVSGLLAASFVAAVLTLRAARRPDGYPQRKASRPKHRPCSAP